MQKHLVSYWRTIGALLAVAAVVAPIGFWLAKSVDFLGFHALAMLGRVVVNVISAGLFVLLSCALIVLIRARRASSNCSDLFLALNARRMHFAPDAASSRNRLPLRSLRRALGAPRYIVGDRVRIKSLQQVAATLDAGGALDSLPFMPEMARYCGQEASVFRCVDKVYDYGGRKDLRRIRNVVLLYGLRCDGASHDRCQAGCYLLWKNAWLEPVATRAESNLSTHTPDDSARLEAQPVLLAASAVTATGVAPVYRCQYTQLVAASEPMSTRDPRQDLRPLREGNVTLAAFVVAVATRIFNALQGMRGGIGFPWVPASATNQSMHAELHLAPGDIVEVRTAREIADTLTIVFGHAVFDGDDRIFSAPICPIRRHFV